MQFIHMEVSKGTTMGVARILRCHPFVKGGIDYVPLKFRLTKILMRPIMDRIRIEEIRKQK